MPSVTSVRKRDYQGLSGKAMTSPNLSGKYYSQRFQSLNTV